MTTTPATLEDNKVNILLVDDRWENLVSLKAVLDSPDYNLVKASSGREALRELLDRDFALILMDVQMPILNGFETANLIKNRERTRNIPIIFVTGVSTDEPFMYKGYGAGAVDYICKPFEPEILRSKVAVFAELYKKNQQLREQEKQLRQAQVKRLEMESLQRERAANEKYKDLVDGISNGIVWMADPVSLVPSFLSPQISAILGFNDGDWVNNTAFWERVLYPEDFERTITALRDCIARKTDLRIEHRFINADGRPIWMQTWARATFVDDHGNGFLPGLQPLRGLSVDISALKRTEEALNASQAGLEFLATASSALSESLDYANTAALVASISVPRFSDYCFFDELSEDGTFNRAAWTAVDMSGLETDLFYRFHPAEEALKAGRFTRINRDASSGRWLGLDTTQPDYPQFFKLLDRIEGASALCVPLIAHERKIGCVTFCRKRGSQPFDPRDCALAEELTRRFAMALDNARLFKEAREAIASRDEFLSIASHELKTPITSLKMQLQMTKMAVKPEQDIVPSAEKLMKVLDVSTRQVDRLTCLVEDLLDVARVRAGKLTYEVESCTLSQILREVAERFAEQLRQAGCALTFELDDSLIGTWDKTRVEQIVVNLLSNAIKYAGGCPIHISTKRIENRAKLTIKDFGPGIPRSRQTKIFERFERAISSRNINGLGLGLFIVKKIVEAHDGQVAVESDLGEGAAFVVELPLKPASLAQYVREQAPPPGLSRTEGRASHSSSAKSI